MSIDLQDLHAQKGLKLATHIWAVAHTSTAFISSPGTTSLVRLQRIIMNGTDSAAGIVYIQQGQASTGTTYWRGINVGNWNEDARIDTDAGQDLILTCSTDGNCAIRVYYTIERASGTSV